jgi:hypothetical protein
MDTENLKIDYLKGCSIKELQEKYKFKGVGTLYYYLKKLGINNRGKIKHYENPFLKESKERDYWLGWIFSDGCVVNTPRNKFVYLACLDFDILLKFKEFCGDRAKLNKFEYITPVSKEKRVMYKVVINSTELVQYFSEIHHISGNKASTLNPDIEINWDLLRGALDGDGSFKKGVVLTSNSKQWIYKVSEFYNSYNIHYTIVKDTAYRLGVYKKEDIRKIYKYLYSNTNLYLARKERDLYRLAKEESLEK